MFWNVCHVPQNNTAHPGISPTKPLFYTIEVYKRTSMDLHSFSEHKWKCPNRGENKVITVHQGGFLSLLERFSMVYVLHEHLSQLLLRISQQSHYGIRFHSSIRACSRSWRVCGGTRRPGILLLSLSHTCSMGLMSGLTAGHYISWMSSSRKTALVMCATWSLTLSCMNMNEFRANTVSTNQHML